MLAQFVVSFCVSIMINHNYERLLWMTDWVLKNQVQKSEWMASNRTPELYVSNTAITNTNRWIIRIVDCLCASVRKYSVRLHFSGYNSIEFSVKSCVLSWICYEDVGFFGVPFIIVAALSSPIRVCSCNYKNQIVFLGKISS